MVVDPDAWLRTIDGRAYVRRVKVDGGVKVGATFYYAGRELAGQQVALRVDAAAGGLVVVHAGAERRRVPIKGVQQCVLPFDTFVDQLAAQARLDRGPSYRTVPWASAEAGSR